MFYIYATEALPHFPKSIQPSIVKSPLGSGTALRHLLVPDAFAMPGSVQVGWPQFKQNPPEVCRLCCHCQDAKVKLILTLLLGPFASSI